MKKLKIFCLLLTAIFSLSACAPALQIGAGLLGESTGKYMEEKREREREEKKQEQKSERINQTDGREKMLLFKTDHKGAFLENLDKQ